MDTKTLKIVVVIMVFSLIASLFGCGKPEKIEPTPDYPFDVTKAYCYHRSGVIAGGDCEVTVEPEDVVIMYTYTKPVSEDECGMSDKGADIYFVGLKEGKAEVTVTFHFPTTESYSTTFSLNVDENLNVTKN